MRLERAVLLAVAAGAALGGPARYAVGQLVGGDADHFPWATLAVNVTGSLALGVVVGVVARVHPGRRLLGAFLGTGFLGAYTTFSTFAVDTTLLVRNGHAGVAALYVAASVGVGLAAAHVGVRWARR